MSAKPKIPLEGPGSAAVELKIGRSALRSPVLAALLGILGGGAGVVTLGGTTQAALPCEGVEGLRGEVRQLSIDVRELRGEVIELIKKGGR